MNRTVEVLRALFVSPEVVWVLGMLVLGLYAPHWLSRAGNAFLGADVPNILPVLSAPFVLVVAAYKISSAILRPEGDRNILMGWPDYWRLRLRVNVSLTFSLIGALAVSVGWLVHRNEYTTTGAGIAFAGLGVAAISLACVAHARQDVADIVDRAG